MRFTLVLVPVAAIVLAGCAGTGAADGSPTSRAGVLTGVTSATASTTSDSGTSSPSASGSSTTTSTSPSPSSTTTTTAPAPTALPTAFADVNQTITDADLKDSITVKRVARQLPWPAGYNASAQAYELVALEMTWTPSKTYTIPIRRQDFAINTGSQFPNTPDALVNDVVKAAGWVLLPDQIDTGNPVTGWLVFKVDPRSAPKLVLDYARPAVTVTGSQTSFPARTFSIGLVG